MERDIKRFRECGACRGTGWVLALIDVDVDDARKCDHCDGHGSYEYWPEELESFEGEITAVAIDMGAL